MNEATAPTKTPTFAMLCCAHGAEHAVKESMASDGWRLAFSRPGFVTAKHDDQVELPSGIFVRTSSLSIGSVRGTSAADNVAQLIDQLAQSVYADKQFDQLHVWPRDRAAIGRFDFEPEIDEVSQAVAETLHQSLPPKWLRCDRANRIAEPDELVLDVVLIDPSHWFFGVHTASTWPTRWPGAIQPIEPKYEPVSRAYYKAAEAITWSGLNFQPGDRVVEIGSAPGGACGRLLELGLNVIGIDPAEMDPRIAGHPKFRHLRARAGDLPRKEYRGVKWLLVDSNVRPEKTLVTVGNIVNHRHSELRGMILTMKIGNYQSASKIDEWVSKIQTWNPKSIRIRQLARNKCEVCFAIET